MWVAVLLLCEWLFYCCVTACSIIVWVLVLLLCEWLFYYWVSGCSIIVWVAVLLLCECLFYYCVSGCSIIVWVALLLLCEWLFYCCVGVHHLNYNLQNIYIRDKITSNHSSGCVIKQVSYERSVYYNVLACTRISHEIRLDEMKLKFTE